jgi:hypothetical protein
LAICTAGQIEKDVINAFGCVDVYENSDIDCNKGYHRKIDI